MVSFATAFPHLLMAHYLTVKEAAKLVEKSPSSIRRIIYPILEKDDHPDRHHVLPAPQEAIQLRLKGENFAWRISEELLRREVPVEAASPTATPKATEAGESSHTTELIAMLRAELDIKNQQIKQHMEMNKDLHERLRESNILIGSLQRQLALPSGKPTTDAQVVEHDSPAPATKASPSKAGRRAGKSAKPAPRKRGLLRRLFAS